MRRRASCLLAAIALVALCGQARAARTVAIAYFDNNTGKPEYDALAKGLADMLITDLSNVRSLQIVERERLNHVLAELKLSGSKFIDPKTAQRLGKGVAAQLIMTGGYTLSGDTLRIDARVVEVQSGRVAASEKVEGRKDEFFALEKDLVDLLIRVVDVKLAAGERGKLRSNATQSFEAWAKYSAGLHAQDRGDDAKARALFQAALDADPNYKAARTAADRLKVIFRRDDQAKARTYQDLRAKLDPRAPDFARQVDDLLVRLDSTVADQLAKKIELLTWLATRELTPATPPLSRVPLDALVIASRHVDDPTQWENIPGVCEYFITRYPSEDYPKSYCKGLLKSLEWKQKTGRAAQQKAWDDQRESDLKNLDPDDWRVALHKNEPAMRKLLSLYAAKR